MSSFASLFLAASLATSTPASCPHDRASFAQWAARQAHALKEASYDQETLQAVQDELTSCQGAIAQVPGVAACLDPLARFTRAQLWEFLPDHLLGSEQPDTQLLFQPPYPEMLQLPRELTENAFLRLLDRNDRPSLDAARARVAEVNASLSDPSLHWQVFEYVSQHLYTPDGTKTLGRFFVYVPGKDFDRYLQFGLQDEPAHRIPNSVSIVAVQKTDPRTHASLATPQAQLIDLWRLRENDGSYRITSRYEVTHQLENCYGCHKTAVLPITPDPATFDAARDGATVKFVNRQMARYGHVQMAGIDMAGYGPGMGPIDSSLRSDGFLAKCAAGQVAPNRLERLRNLMTCQKCHDGDTRGLLNYPSAWRSSPPYDRSLVEDYLTTHRKMPPGADDLSTEERKALFSCVTQEYYEGDGAQPGLLESWLAGGSCFRR